MKPSAILTYHSIDDSGSVISVSPEAFRRQMQMLADSGTPVVPLAEVLRRPRRGGHYFRRRFPQFS